MPLSILLGLDLLVLDSSLYSRSEVEMLPSLDSLNSEPQTVIQISINETEITSILLLAGVFKCAVPALLGYLLQVRKKSLGSILDIPGETEPRHRPSLPRLANLHGFLAERVVGAAMAVREAAGGH